MTETKAAGTGGAGERSRAEQPATTGEETTSAGGIAAKLLAAARAVGNVEKSGRNARHGYDYVTIDDVVRAARTALLAEGLLVHSEITAIAEREIRSQNSSGLLIRLETRWRVLDAETGEASVHPWTSYGSDYPGDKALYKALSGARKYFLIDLLQIAVGDDPEAEDPVPAAGTPAMVAVGDGDGASAEPARGALVALTGGPAADRGSAGPTPAASKRFDRALRASGYGGEAVRELARGLYGESVRERLRDEELDELGTLLRVASGRGIDEIGLVRRAAAVAGRLKEAGAEDGEEGSERRRGAVPEAFRQSLAGEAATEGADTAKADAASGGGR